MNCILTRPNTPSPPSEKCTLDCHFCQIFVAPCSLPKPHTLRAVLFPNLHFGGCLLMGGGLALSSSARKTQQKNPLGLETRWYNVLYTFATRSKSSWMVNHPGSWVPGSPCIFFLINPSWIFDIGFWVAARWRKDLQTFLQVVMWKGTPFPSCVSKSKNLALLALPTKKQSLETQA